MITISFVDKYKGSCSDILKAKTARVGNLVARQQDIGKRNILFYRFGWLLQNNSMRGIASRNPFTGEVKETFKFISKEELSRKLDRANAAFEIQKKRTLQERAQIIKRVGEGIQARIKEVSETITFEMGKPIVDAEREAKKAIYFCDYYSQNYQPLLPQFIKTQARKHTVVKYLPIGIVYNLVPFNFPLYLNVKGGLPSLLIGNSLLVRNADSCPNLGRLIEEIMVNAGFCNGEYQNVFTAHDQLDQIFEYPTVQGVCFTGSSRGGAAIAEKAGKHLIKSVLQLGGNDPFVVLQDGDINEAVSEALKGRCANAGQVCFSPKRFIIDKKHYESFRTKLIDGLSKVKFGDPMDRSTQMGPLAREDLVDHLHHQLTQMPKSYKIIYQRNEMKKPFFPITVIQGSDQPWDQECFGPVFKLFKAENEQHALKIANSGTFGLGGSVISANRGEEVLDQIRCGIGFVNGVPTTDPKYPTGGVWRSGYGRECGLQGYREFANIKTYFVN